MRPRACPTLSYTLLAVAGLVLGAAWPRAAAHAQGSLQVLSAPAPEFVFGDHATFTLSARGDEAIDRVVLFVQAGEQPAAGVPGVQFTPGREVSATLRLDLGTSPLPPFSVVSYWWEIGTRSGAALSTPPAEFHYEDSRFVWQRLDHGGLAVSWYDGDEAFGQAAMDLATTTLARANYDIRAPLPERTAIYIYASEGDVRAALASVGQAWADGHADPALGVVIILVPPGLAAEARLGRELPHELTHVLLYRATGANYARVPTWLDEGLAVINQTRPDPDLEPALAAARDTGEFLSLQRLCGPFPGDDVRLAYAQSTSVVRYIRQRFGSEGMHRLVTTYAEGASCEAGVPAALGLTLGELETQWRRDAVDMGVAQRWRLLAPWALLAGVVLLGPLVFIALTARRR